jgi:hypothetical protein
MPAVPASIVSRIPSSVRSPTRGRRGTRHAPEKEQGEGERHAEGAAAGEPLPRAISGEPAPGANVPVAHSQLFLLKIRSVPIDSPTISIVAATTPHGCLSHGITSKFIPK